MTSRAQLIDQIQEFLTYQQEERVHSLEISPETLALLKPAPAAKAPAPPRPAAPRPTPRVSPPAEPEPAGIEVTGKTLKEIAQQISTCTACALKASRKNTVPGEGNPNQPDILFIGEAPGIEDDAQGRPFSGEAGALLDKMIAAMGYRREDVFITTVAKCLPPDSRIPLPEELATCMPHLKAQIALIQPKTIVALGKTAVESLLGKPVAITRMRGTWNTYEGVDLMPTFHPGYLLKAPTKKREVWADLQAVLAKLGKTLPAKK